MANLLELSAKIIDNNERWGDMRITQELSEVGDRIAMVESFSHLVVFKTDDGLAIFDTSLPMTIQPCVAAMRGWSDAPVEAIVYTHGHTDHVGGARFLVDEAKEKGRRAPQIIGHENVPARFDRYGFTSGYNKAINERQFGFKMPAEREFLNPKTPMPTMTFRDQTRVDIGGTLMELRHAKGETDDHLWAWIPEHRAICVGDFLLPTFPNAGNPQKQQRFPLEWARALREMAATGAELLLPAHGLPIGGQARIKKVLDRVASALEYLVKETLDLMNQGAPLDTILHTVKMDPKDLDLPYLVPLYDEPEFVLHTIYRLYGGWYDGNPANLKPAKEAALAKEVASLSGGADKLVARARQLAEIGDYRLACHLAEMAVQAEPDSVEAHGARAEVYAARREKEVSLMAKGIYGHAVRQSLAVADPDAQPDAAAQLNLLRGKIQ